MLITKNDVDPPSTASDGQVTNTYVDFSYGYAQLLIDRLDQLRQLSNRIDHRLNSRTCTFELERLKARYCADSSRMFPPWIDATQILSTSMCIVSNSESNIYFTASSNDNSTSVDDHKLHKLISNSVFDRNWKLIETILHHFDRMSKHLFEHHAEDEFCQRFFAQVILLYL